MNHVEAASRTWQGNWRDKTRERVAALGYDSVEQFMRAFPGAPYIELVNRLGDDVAAIQVECLQFDEATARNELRAAAMDSLVRDLRRYLDKGWEGGAVGNFTTIQAKVAWIGRLEGSSRNKVPSDELNRRGEVVWCALEQLQPPIGWLPTQMDDSYIVGAFVVGWPEGE